MHLNTRLEMKCRAERPGWAARLGEADLGELGEVRMNQEGSRSLNAAM